VRIKLVVVEAAKEMAIGGFEGSSCPLNGGKSNLGFHKLLNRYRYTCPPRECTGHVWYLVSKASPGRAGAFTV